LAGALLIAGFVWWLSRDRSDSTTVGDSAKEIPADIVAGPSHPEEADTRQQRPAAAENWTKAVPAMPPGRQGAVGIGKLKEKNVDFDGKFTHKIDNGVVTELGFSTDNITDVAPVRALTGLKSLSCRGSAPGKGKLADLSPLAGTALTTLHCGFNEISDLSPL